MKKHLSSLILATVPLIWGLSFSAQKTISELSALTIGSVRSIFATLFLLLAIPFLDKLTKNGRAVIKGKKPDFNRHEIIGGICCGTILAIASALQQFGISDGTDAGKAAFISGLYVVIVPVLYSILGRKSPFTVWISVPIAVLGFYLLCIKQDFTIVSSDLLILISAAIFAGHIIVIDRFSPNCDGARLSCIQFFTAFVLNTVMTLIFDSPIDFSLVARCLPSLLYLGIFSSGVAYTLQIIGQKNTPPAVASTILSLESVFGAIGAAIILGEKMLTREYIGCVIVFAAVILAQLDLSSQVAKLKEHFSSKNKKYDN